MTSKKINAELAIVESKIQILKGKIHTLECELEKLEDREYELKQALEQEYKRQRTQAYLKDIAEVTPDNSIYVHLCSDTKTTPIMDKFYHSNKSYLIFDRIFTLSWQGGFQPISLIISKRWGDIDYHYSRLTMTDLKKSAGSFVSKRSLDFLNEDSRKYPLYYELILILERLQSGENENIMTFQSPCILGGQTYSNQSGYGSEYCGDDLIHQGTLYGETT